MWEDPANAEGGKWVLTVKDDEGVLDNAWEELVSSIAALVYTCYQQRNTCMTCVLYTCLTCCIRSMHGTYMLHMHKMHAICVLVKLLVSSTAYTPPSVPFPPPLTPSLPLSSLAPSPPSLPQLLAMIGGLIQSCHAINGAVVSRRKKGDRVALWTRKKSVKVNLDIW